MTKLAIALLAVLVAGPAASRPLTVQDVVTIERAGDPNVSPDGRQLVYAMSVPNFAENRSTGSLWLAAVDGAEAPRRLAVSDQGASGARWSPDGRSLYFLSSRGGSVQVWKTDLAGNDAVQVTQLPLDVGTFRLSPDGRSIVVALDVYADCPTLQCTVARNRADKERKTSAQLYTRLYLRNVAQWTGKTRNHLYALRLDMRGIAAGDPKPLLRGFDGNSPTRPAGDQNDFVFSPDGRTLYFKTILGGAREPWTRARLWRVPVDGSRPPAEVDPAATDIYAPVVAPDGTQLAYLASDGYPFLQLVVRDLRSGKRRLLAPGLNPSALAWIEDGRALLAQAQDRSDECLFRVDVRTGAVTRVTGAGTIGTFHVGGGTLAFTRSDFTHPPQLYVATGLAASPRQVTNVGASALDGVELAQPEPFEFAGWNGEKVTGWMTPPHRVQRDASYPVVLFVHGVPHQVRNNGWSPRWNQLFAAAGYGVVEINTHGSMGFGRAFEEAALAHHGDRPLEDLKKGWEAALARFPFLDGTRACAIGNGQGGLMTNWIEGVWGEAWRCLVTSDGVLDTRMAALVSDEPYADWYYGGTVWDRPGAYELHNPINHAAAWKTPMLVIHGGRDFRNPLDQGIALFQLLQTRGVPSEFLYFPDEPFVTTRMHNTVQWHETVSAWLQRWTGKQ